MTSGSPSGVREDGGGASERTLTLDDIGLRNGVKQASNSRDLLGQHQRMLSAVPGDVNDIVLILGVDAAGTANTFAEFLPSATIHLLSVRSLKGSEELRQNVRYRHCPSNQDRIDYLSCNPRPQFIVENGTNRKSQKLNCFREFVPYLSDGGVYAVEELKAVTIASLQDRDGDNIVELLNRLALLRLSLGEPEGPYDRELADGIGAITFGENVAYVTKRGDHLFKLRDSIANVVLDGRFGSTWGRVHDVRPAYQFRSAAQMTSHGQGPILDRQSISVPDRFLREYRGATCMHRQRVTLGGYFLPDTFRHHMNSRLFHVELANASHDMAATSARTPKDPERLDGQYYYFDTEYPGHFGHVTSEVVTRYWGWREAVRRNPDIRPLISQKRGAREIPSFQKAIFEALDIPVDRITYIPPGEAVIVESLVAATPALAMPQYVDRSLGEVWGQIRSRLSDHSSHESERIFSSRRPKKTRTCLNASEVEQFFADLGFTVFYPEDHSFEEQVRMFAGARIVAGFGGSNMFNTMYAPGATKVVVSGTSYRANNEQLIASVVGGDIHYFWGRSEIEHPKGKWTKAAYLSNFTVDLGRYGSEIERIVTL